MTAVRSGLDLVPLTADDEAGVRAWFDLEAAALAADRPNDPPPCWQEHRVALSAPWPGQDIRVWLARRDGEAVGCAVLELPTLDNLDNAFVDVVVAPPHRRGGIGTALGAHLLAQARAAGRVRVIAEACETPGAGPAFAARLGAARALVEQRRRLAFPPTEGVLALLEAEARAAATGYELVQWLGATPDEHVEAMAYLAGRMSIDAPLDDLTIEPERFDVARIRATEAAWAARSWRRAVTGAVHAASGRLVAFTEICVRASASEHGSQCDTIVDPNHRGHRLGMLVKLANLALAHREHPRMRWITTWNADSNPYMVSINEAMGFRPLDAWAQWQLAL